MILLSRLSGLAVHGCMFVDSGIDKPLVLVNLVLARGGRISGHAVGLGILADSLPGRPSGLAIPAPHVLVFLLWGRDVLECVIRVFSWINPYFPDQDDHGEFRGHFGSSVHESRA